MSVGRVFHQELSTDPGDDEASAISRKMLEQAVKQGEFAVEYQPVASLRYGTIDGAEAIPVWSHPSRGILAPEEFYVDAERIGAVALLHGFVIDEACRQLGQWNVDGNGAPSVSIGLSVAQLGRADIADQLEQAVTRNRLSTSQLTLEISERALALDAALLFKHLKPLRQRGYQEAHTVSGLKGAPPGYVGYGEGGVLTEAVRRRPYSVVLLDEIEKAHSDVHEMFYQVLDKGYMEDGDGRYIDFRNTTILMTSNVGFDLTSSLCADEALAPDLDGLRSALTPELLKAFPAAFLGRVTAVPYRPLGQDSLAQIVRLHLDRVVRRMAENNRIELAYAPSVADYIVGRCLVHETGARLLIGFIEQHVLPRLARQWLDAFGSKHALTRIEMDVADSAAAPADALVFRSSSDALPTAKRVD